MEDVEVPAIPIQIHIEEENEGTWENTDCTQTNEKDNLPSPYFRAGDQSPINLKKVKSQPFLSTASRSRLEQLLKKDNFN